MNVTARINALDQLGRELSGPSENWLPVISNAVLQNPWFTTDNCRHSLRAISEKYLSKVKLQQWTARYDLSKFDKNKVVGVVTAGNIPMVGLHDVLSVLITGNSCQLKLSEKDHILMEYFLQRLTDIEPSFGDKIQLRGKLENFDAIICTGSNNTARYFEHYFGKYRHIIRRNRNSVAILTGDESEGELVQLGADVFTYFGLGCRNVSKIFIPENFDLLRLKAAWDQPYGDVMRHHKYKHNLDYQRTVYLMNQVPMADIDFINIVENKGMTSPIACLYYERYTEPGQVEAQLQSEAEHIQCIVGKGFLPFGSSQEPELWDYADGVDTIDFILSL